MCHGIIRNRDRFVDSIVAEAGKPKVQAEQEVDRSITTFSIASEEASRIVGGENLPIDIDERSEGACGDHQTVSRRCGLHASHHLIFR